jgi:hypothetical protein
MYDETLIPVGVSRRAPKAAQGAASGSAGAGFASSSASASASGSAASGSAASGSAASGSAASGSAFSVSTGGGRNGAYAAPVFAQHGGHVKRASWSSGSSSDGGRMSQHS